MEDESREMQIIYIHTFDSKLESIEKMLELGYRLHFETTQPIKKLGIAK